jgi:hypothetical protein
VLTQANNRRKHFTEIRGWVSSWIPEGGMSAVHG